MLYVAQVAVCSQTNTKHINTVWAERTVVQMFLIIVWHDAFWKIPTALPQVNLFFSYRDHNGFFPINCIICNGDAICSL
jgi:hypothetical protein